MRVSANHYRYKLSYYLRLKPSDRHRTFVRAVSILMIAILAGCGNTPSAKTERSALLEHSYLVKNPKSRLDLSLRDNNQGWNGFNKVYIDVQNVSFQKHWLRDNKSRILHNYVPRIQKDYAELLKKSLEKTFTKDEKYTVVQAPGNDVITFQSTIKDLIIRGPETIGRSKFLVETAGIATIYSEALHPNGKVLAIMEDRKETRDRTFHRLERASRATNYFDFRLLMEDWGKRISGELL